MKAYGYVRVSGKGQVKGDGFRRQEEEIRAYCDRRGIELVQVFQEQGVSGTTDETARPAFQEMVGAILRNGVNTIIVEGLDRLARELRIQETLLIYLVSKGITLISVRTEEDVTAAIQEDPMKKALIQIQGVFAELEKNLLVKKLRAAREAIRAEKGKCEGRKFYHETAPELIAEVKRLYRKPRNGKRRTFQQIADELNGQGLVTVSGKTWTKYNVQHLVRTAIKA